MGNEIRNFSLALRWRWYCSKDHTFQSYWRKMFILCKL